MRTNIIFASLVLSLVASCGGPLLFAEVADKQVCVTVPNQPVQGSGITTRVPFPIIVTVPVDVGKGIPGLDKQNALTGNIKLNTVVLDTTATGTPTDLSNIDTIKVEALDANNNVLQTMTYTKQPLANPNQIVFTFDQPQDLLPTLKAVKGKITLNVTFDGLLPKDNWTTDVTTCLQEDVTADLTKM